MYSNPKAAIADANRQILIAGTVLFAAFLPILFRTSDSRIDACVLGVEAALSLVLFLVKGRRRAAIWRNWECSTQAALLRAAFPEEPEAQADEKVADYLLAA